MPRFIKTLDQWRRTRSPLDNAVVDDVLAGRLGRREFLQHGSRIGLSALAMAGILRAAGLAPVGRASAQAGKPGGTVRIAQITPSGAIEPVSVSDQGGLLPLALAGDFLVYDGPDLRLRPMLALSWEPNKDGSIWTFKLREGVKFHDGRVMTADDVVASIDRLADPANGSNALSALKGVLSKGGTTKVDDHTVRFTLDAPNGNFPYYVSSDNYNAIIVPADYAGDFEKTFNGTGPFRIEKYTPKVGASFVRNPDYWDGVPLVERVEISFYAELQPQILALLGGQVDIIQQVSVQGGQTLFDNPAVKIIRLKSDAHRQIHMKNKGGFADKRVRQAMALTLDRPAIVKGLFRGLADLGNDSPFAPIFPSTDTTVPQRTKDVAKAKALMAEAGMGSGFNVSFTTMQLQELPTLATLLRNAAAEIGIHVTLKIEDVGAYYGDAVPGKSDWLDSEFGMTDYGHRGTPNVFLAAPLLSTGTWNSAEFKNPAYDKLVAAYIAALDPAAQKAQAGAIQRLLLDETPVIFPFFYDYLSATSSNLDGASATAMGQVFLHRASFI